MRVHAAARILTIVLGLLGVAWGAATFPVFKRDAAVTDIAQRILRGHAFRRQVLIDQAAALNEIENASYCDARALRSAAVIRGRIAENALAEGDTVHVGEDIAAARTAIRKALSCSPTDAYLWLTLLWADTSSDGFKPSDLDLLRLSYEDGPYEGWLMGLRNRVALSIYSSLPPDLADRALTEFAKLLQPEFIVTAVDNFTGPGWPIRARLLERIKDAPERQRQMFAQILDERGYDVAVPGIERTRPPGR